MRNEYAELGEKVQAVDFDHVFRIENGAVVDVPGVYAPTVTHDETDDVHVDGEGWTCLTGMTGQYSYNGAVMHPSEYIGGLIAARLVEMTETAAEDGERLAFAVVVVWDFADDGPEASEDDMAGWAIAYRQI